MLTLIAIALALLVLPAPWGWLVVGLALALDAVEIAIWLTMRGKRSIAGEDSVVGARASVLTVCRPEGRVQVKGQIWKARCDRGADPGDEVIVTSIEGLLLTVERESDDAVWDDMPRTL